MKGALEDEHSSPLWQTAEVLVLTYGDSMLFLKCVTDKGGSEGGKRFQFSISSVECYRKQSDKRVSVTCKSFLRSNIESTLNNLSDAVCCHWLELSCIYFWSFYRLFLKACSFFGDSLQFYCVSLSPLHCCFTALCGCFVPVGRSVGQFYVGLHRNFWMDFS